MENLPQAVIYYVAFVLSTTLHEAAHAWAAKRGGDLTAYHGGQVSLDPLPHIRREPFGMVILPILSVLVSGWPFGFASAPYDRAWSRRHPRRAAWMALAGPGANLAILLGVAVLIRIGMLAGVFHAPDSIKFMSSIVGTNEQPLWDGVAFLCSVFFSLNLVLFALNLIPLPPLDGSAAVPLVLGESATEKYLDFTEQPMLGIIGILIAWRIFDEIFNPVFDVAVKLLYPGVSYIST